MEHSHVHKTDKTGNKRIWLFVALGVLLLLSVFRALGFVTEEMDKVYKTVLKAQLAGIAATKAGVTGQAMDGAARKVIPAAGYGDYFGHGYGHSLGILIHEAPNANTKNDQPMPENAVVSAEPGIYLPGKFGVRIEDVTVLTKDGCEILTKSPKNLIIL